MRAQQEHVSETLTEFCLFVFVGHVDILVVSCHVDILVVAMEIFRLLVVMYVFSC